MRLRFGEVVGLRVQDIDFTKQTLNVCQVVVESNGTLKIGKPKSRTSERCLVLSDGEANLLSSHLAHHAVNEPAQLLFTDSRDGLIRRSNFRRRVLLPALKQTGLEGLTFHGLRHSAATEWVANGIDARTVQHRLGHADPELVLRLYAHFSNEADKAASETLNDLYWNDTNSEEKE